MPHTCGINPSTSNNKHLVPGNDIFSILLREREQMQEDIKTAEHAEWCTKVNGTDEEKYDASWAVTDAKAVLEKADESLWFLVQFGFRAGMRLNPILVSGLLADIPLDSLNAEFKSWQNTLFDLAKKVGDLQRSQTQLHERQNLNEDAILELGAIVARDADKEVVS